MLTCLSDLSLLSRLVCFPLFRSVAVHRLKPVLQAQLASDPVLKWHQLRPALLTLAPAQLSVQRMDPLGELVCLLGKEWAAIKVRLIASRSRQLLMKENVESSTSTANDGLEYQAPRSLLARLEDLEEAAEAQQLSQNFKVRDLSHRHRTINVVIILRSSLCNNLCCPGS